MVDFEGAMSILENTTRREILRFLVKEPHYPLQLSEILERRKERCARSSRAKNTRTRV